MKTKSTFKSIPPPDDPRYPEANKVFRPMNPTQSQPPAAGEAAHLETPWHFKKDGGRYEIWPKDRGHVHCYVGTVQRKEDAAFIVRACNSHAALSRAWSELAYHANELANAKTKPERDAAALKVFCAIGDAKDALPELRTLSEIRAALESAKEDQL